MLNGFSTVTFIALCVGCLVLWRRTIRNKPQEAELLAPRLRDPHPIGLLDVLLMFSGWVFAQLLGIELAQAVLKDDLTSLESRSTAMLYVGGFQTLITLICLGFYRAKYRSSEAFGMVRQSIGFDVRLGVITFVLIIPPLLTIQMLLNFYVKYEHGTLETLKNAKSSFPIVSAWISAVLVAPVVEEIFFRGILQNWLQRLGNTHPDDFSKLIKGGWFAADETNIVKTTDTETDRTQVYFDSKLRWSPIFLSAGLFAAAHFGQGLAWIPLFFLAVGLGYLFRQTGSILPGIVVHFLLNFYSMFWATMAVYFKV